MAEEQQQRATELKQSSAVVGVGAEAAAVIEVGARAGAVIRVGRRRAARASLRAERPRGG